MARGVPRLIELRDARHILEAAGYSAHSGNFRHASGHIVHVNPTGTEIRKPGLIKQVIDIGHSIPITERPARVSKILERFKPTA